LPASFSLTTALYRLDRTNTRATDPNDPTRILQTGSQRSQGFEIGLAGSIVDAWSISAGYAYQHAYIRSATTAAPAGAAVAQVPRHSFSLWNKYRVTPQLSVGLAVVGRTASFAAIDNTVVLPGYTEVEAAVYYTFNPRWKAQVNIENLLNRRYYADADSNTNISPASPRALRAGLTVRW
jgi:catecholate siderophore receptor